MSSATVLVRGSAVVPAEPDEVELSLEVTALRLSPEEALREVAQKSDALTRVLDQLEVPAKGRLTSGLSVREEWEYDKQHNRHHVGFTSRNSISVRLTDPALVGTLMNRATREADARISGPWWRIALDNPARTKACEDAAAEAKRKAEAYARALGARLGAVVTVTEPGLTGRSDHEGSRVMYSPSMGEPGSPEVRVEAGELEISASVEVEFRLEHG